MGREIHRDEILHAIESLFEKIKSVQIASLSTTGEPENSYTPYLKYGDRIYVFISELANHTQNLMVNPCASLFFIEDEAQSKNIFARTRVTLKAEAYFVDRKDEEWASVMDLFEQEHGNTVSLLKGLSDFHLVGFNIQSGVYVQGFGQAFAFDRMDFESIKLLTGK